MPERQHPLDRLTDRSDEARRTRTEIDDWLAGRGSLVVLVLLVALVVAIVLGFAHV